jgi:alpha-beta hydrolase superfamily lysophospholipase
MQERQAPFYSEGYQLAGTVYVPDDYRTGEKRPAIVPCSGYQGVQSFYPRLFARQLTQAGYVCLGFDYRGFARSEGPRGRVILDEQVVDIRNAITWLSLQPEVEPQCLGLVGWGMGAANVVRAAAQDERVRAVAAINGFFVGTRWLRTIHSYVTWHAILQAIAEDRIRRVTTGHSQLVEPFLHYPLDPDTAEHVQKELATLPGFGEQVTLEFSESLTLLNAEKDVAAIAPRPLFIAHGKHNRLHPVDESLALYAAAHEPKELHLLAGKHNDFMYHDHPVFVTLMARLTAFLARCVATHPEG